MIKSFIQFITESLDNPWKLHELDKTDLFHKKVKEVADQDYPKHKKLKVYKTTDNDNNSHGHILEFHNKGAIEIHHLDKNNDSGKINSDANKPNPRFIATMKQRVDHHTGNGHSVRIVGTDKMINTYHRISKTVYNKKNI